MIHPVQFLISSRDGNLLFCVIKNMIQVFKVDVKINNCSLIGEWIDEYDNKQLIKEKVEQEQMRQLAGNATKKMKTNDGSIIEQPCKEPKVPVPGPGAPPLYQYIRCLTLSDDESILVACTDSDKAAVLFKVELENANCLSLLKRQPFPKRPSAITFSADKELILADKFGDVYVTSLECPVTNMTPEPVLGHVSMLTDIAVTKDNLGKQYVLTADRDEHIKISHYPQTFIVNKWLFGHKQFVSTLCVPKWKPNFLFSGGGDDSIYSWDWQEGKLLFKFDVGELVAPYLTDFHFPPERFLLHDGTTRKELSVVKILSFEQLPYLAVIFEATKVIFILECNKSTGELTLHQKLELNSNLVSLAVAEMTNQLVVSLDDRKNGQEELIKFFKYEDGKFTEDESKNSAVSPILKSSLERNTISQVDADSIYPLYHIAQLRKRGDHYS
ncbi:Trm82p Ecym_4218 [Eremothecium cymbalariae DBVPG|uniref:Uncharacterized protein n=1 Tax=Eremothecium cymbalariae (strain CBS 270.75 / DBVPG 7215 / KCTC 17166 / NRRL Y-17582) TaxID=931890 RepID=G8JTD2_ERECY|nr:hypothetical protein Ecym_4218 [Eremothecium cymbalariae DBVPG\